VQFSKALSSKDSKPPSSGSCTLSPDIVTSWWWLASLISGSLYSSRRYFLSYIQDWFMPMLFLWHVQGRCRAEPVMIKYKIVQHSNMAITR
jgi:hypothetical protein